MRIILLYIILSITLTASADNSKLSQKQFKKDIATVKANLKADKDLEKSETTLRKYLSDSLFAQDKGTHLLLTECIRKQYAVGNEKMYLKEKVDTAAIVRTNIRLFLAMEALDSIDAMPDAKGNVAPSYRKKHAEMLLPLWGNLLKGGIFFFAHSMWNDAWGCFDTYLDCHKQPLFTAEKLDSTQYGFASFLAVMTAYNKKELPKAMKYADGAITYMPRREMTLQKLADLCAEKKDTANYLRFLERGNNEYPHSGYFFPNLIDYYCSIKEYDKALVYADNATKQDSLNMMFLSARHNVLMMLHRYDEALEDGINLLHFNDALPIPNYNVACIYYEKAQETMKQSDKSFRLRMKEAQKYYKLCLPYMERYRKLMPKDTTLWRPVLYDVYLNLNMGKEFDSLPKE